MLSNSRADGGIDIYIYIYIYFFFNFSDTINIVKMNWLKRCLGPFGILLSTIFLIKLVTFP